MGQSLTSLGIRNRDLELRTRPTAVGSFQLHRLVGRHLNDELDQLWWTELVRRVR